VIEGEEKAGGGRRSSEEQEERRKMGGEGEELSGGGWQRGWVRISLRRASWQGSGAAPAPSASVPAQAASEQPSAAPVRAGRRGCPGSGAETELWGDQALPQRHCLAPVAGGARRMEGQACHWCLSPAAG